MDIIVTNFSTLRLVIFFNTQEILLQCNLLQFIKYIQFKAYEIGPSFVNSCSGEVPSSRVARFFLFQTFQIGKNLTNDLNYTKRP
jgi:hypothetical protein